MQTHKQETVLNDPIESALCLLEAAGVQEGRGPGEFAVCRRCLTPCLTELLWECVWNWKGTSGGHCRNHIK